MSNRQRARFPWLSKGDRPAGVVYSASHGLTEFHGADWFKEKKVKPCKAWKKCGIRSHAKHPHFHPGGES